MAPRGSRAPRGEDASGRIWTRLAVPILLLLASGWAIERDAHGDPEGLADVTWLAPAECPDVGYVRAEVRRLLGSSSTAPASADQQVAVRAKVTRTRHRWRVDLSTTTTTGRGSRSLESESCRGLADATALIVALMVNPDRVAAVSSSVSVPVSASATASAGAGAIGAAPSLAPEETLPTASVGSAVMPSAPVPESSGSAAPTVLPPGGRDGARPGELRESGRTGTLQGGLGVGVMGDVGTLDDFTPGVWLSLGVRAGAARLEGFGAWEPDARVPLAGNPKLGGKFASFSGGLWGCWSLTRGKWEVGPCVGGEVVVVTARSTGTSPTFVALQPQTRSWLSGLFGGHCGLRLSRWAALRLDLAGALATRRDAFNIGHAGGGTIHTVPSLTGEARIGVELLF